jgi:hypothetical protein
VTYVEGGVGGPAPYGRETAGSEWTDRSLALESLHDVEALCLEICAELREVVEMLATYRDIIGNAARLIARAARYPLIGGAEAAELARELARMAYIEEEIDRLLPSSHKG